MRKRAAGATAGLALLALLSAHAEAASAKGSWQLRANPARAKAARSLKRMQAGPAAVFRARVAVRPAAPGTRIRILSAYESSVLARINALRGVRGLRPLRVSRGLSAAAAFHTNQMGARGFFEHESANGAPFWRRIERFYPSRRYRTWSVGENIVWGSPDISPIEAVREWMLSPPHRENLLSREWREIGLGAGHFASAPGEYDGRAVTIVTADFGARR